MKLSRLLAGVCSLAMLVYLGSSLLGGEVASEPVPVGGVGQIVGTVSFQGSSPKNLKISLGSDAYCSGKHKTTLFTETVLVKNGKLKNVLVYIKKGKGLQKSYPAPKEPVVLNQTGCVYEPHIIALMKGQTLTIKNSDAKAHNVHFLPRRNPEQNLSQSTKGAKTNRQFKIPEVGAPIKCDIHPWMKAYMHVMKNPFFAVTAEDGTFTIPNVPPGVYQLELWHEKLRKIRKKKIKVTANKDTRLDVTFKP